MTNRKKAQQAARSAQRRLSQQQAQRRRTRWTSAIAAVVLLAAALVGVGVWQANRPSDVPVPAAATADEAGVAVGTGPVTVEVYLDFLCPACQQFDQAARPALDEYLADGVVTLVYRPIAILDDRTTTEFSSRAASAAGCAADGGALDEFVAVMMDNQPQEGTVGLSDAEISQLGVEAGLMDAEFDRCVRDGSYRDWARANTNAAASAGVQGTPTVLVDGTRLEPLTVDGLVAAVDAAADQNAGD